MVVNDAGSDSFFGGIYGRDMENGVITPPSASFNGGGPDIAFSGLGVSLDTKNRYHSAPDSFLPKHLHHGQVFQERRLAMVQPLHGPF